jgi:hypothetical protein
MTELFRLSVSVTTNAGNESEAQLLSPWSVSIASAGASAKVNVSPTHKSEPSQSRATSLEALCVLLFELVGSREDPFSGAQARGQ